MIDSLPNVSLSLRLRPLTLQDAEMLLAWYNDPATLQSVLNPEPTLMENHLKWLQSRVNGKPGEINRIAETEDGTPVGYADIRFDPANPSPVELHYRVAPEWRGRGIASAMLPIFIREIIAPIGDGTFKSPIIKGNIASEKVAAKLGLTPGPERPISDTDPRIIVEWVGGKAR